MKGWKGDILAAMESRIGETDIMLKTAANSLGVIWMSTADSVKVLKGFCRKHTEYNVVIRWEKSGDNWFNRGAVTLIEYEKGRA